MAQQSHRMGEFDFVAQQSRIISVVQYLICDMKVPKSQTCCMHFSANLGEELTPVCHSDR